MGIILRIFFSCCSISSHSYDHQEVTGSLNNCLNRAGCVTGASCAPCLLQCLSALESFILALTPLWAGLLLMKRLCPPYIWLLCHKLDLIWNELTILSFIPCCHFWMCPWAGPVFWSHQLWRGCLKSLQMPHCFSLKYITSWTFLRRWGGGTHSTCVVQIISHLIWLANTWLSPPQ